MREWKDVEVVHPVVNADIAWRKEAALTMLKAYKTAWDLGSGAEFIRDYRRDEERWIKTQPRRDRKMLRGCIEVVLEDVNALLRAERAQMN